MAMPTSGSLSLFSAGKEVVVGAREAPIPDSTVLQNFPNGISLTEISTGTGAASDDPINWRSGTNLAAYEAPDGNTPHALSEFYAYDDDYAHLFEITNSTAEYRIKSYGDTVISAEYVGSGRISRGFTSTSNSDNIDPIAVSGYKWREFKFKVKNTSGSTRTYRPVIYFWADGTDYRRDFCVNSIRIGSTHYHATNETMKYFTNTTVNTIPTSQTGFSNVTLGSTAQVWNIESGGGTPSSGTGPDTGVIYSSITGNYETTTGRYWYFEASSASTPIWSALKPSSTKTIANNVTDTVTFIYSAWSNDVQTWAFSFFSPGIEVVS